MRGLLKLVLAVGVIAGLWLLLRELLEEQSDQAPQSEGAAAGPASSEPASSEPAPSDPSVQANGASPRTKAELYREAQRLDVAGRSKMSKQQLAEAVAARRS